MAFPFRERRVAAVPAGVRVRTGLDGPPVVAGRDDDRIDAVHDSLVVRGRAVGVHGRERVRVEDAFGHVVAAVLRRRQHVRRQRDACPREAEVREVRQDAQPHRAAGDLLDASGDGLGHRVDGVRAHRVAHVDDQVHHDHRAARRVVEHVDLDVAAAAAESDERAVAFVGHRDDLVAVPQDREPRAVRIGHADHLDLRPHDRARARRLEAAAVARELRHERRRGDDRGFLDDHRHEHVAAVDPEVAGDGERQFERADHVLDHPVGDAEGQGAGRGESRDVLGRKRRSVGDVAQAFGGRERTEVGQPRVGNHGCAPPGRCSCGR